MLHCSRIVLNIMTLNMRRVHTRTIQSRDPEKNHILVVMSGTTARTVVGSTLKRIGYRVTSMECPTQALMTFASDPLIDGVVVAGDLIGTRSDALFARARRLNKPIVTLSRDACMSEESMRLCVAHMQR